MKKARLPARHSELACGAVVCGDGIGMVRFGVADVVRHPIVGRIVEAYEGKDG